MLQASVRIGESTRGRAAPFSSFAAVARLILVLAAVALAAGCGLIHGGIAYLLIGLSEGGGGAASPNVPPTAVVDPIGRTVGPVQVYFRLIDGNSDALEVRFEYSSDGGDTYHEASSAEPRRLRSRPRRARSCTAPSPGACCTRSSGTRRRTSARARSRRSAFV